MTLSRKDKWSYCLSEINSLRYSGDCAPRRCGKEDQGRNHHALREMEEPAPNHLQLQRSRADAVTVSGKSAYSLERTFGPGTVPALHFDWTL